MAFIDVSQRRVNSHGSLRRETGYFTDSGGGNYEIQTKVGRIIHFELAPIGVTSLQNSAESYWNSDSTAGMNQDGKNGIVHIAAGLTSSGTYTYEAIGVGA